LSRFSNKRNTTQYHKNNQYAKYKQFIKSPIFLQIYNEDVFGLAYFYPVSNRLNFSVGLHPLFQTTKDLTTYIARFKKWNKNLTLLYRLRVIITHFDKYLNYIPSLDHRMKAPAWWWEPQIDDKYLLFSTYQHGLARYDLIRNASEVWKGKAWEERVKRKRNSLMNIEYFVQKNQWEMSQTQPFMSFGEWFDQNVDKYPIDNKLISSTLTQRLSRLVKRLWDTLDSHLHSPIVIPSRQLFSVFSASEISSRYSKVQNEVDNEQKLATNSPTRELEMKSSAISSTKCQNTLRIQERHSFQQRANSRNSAHFEVTENSNRNDVSQFQPVQKTEKSLRQSDLTKEPSVKSFVHNNLNSLLYYSPNKHVISPKSTAPVSLVSTSASARRRRLSSIMLSLSSSMASTSSAVSNSASLSTKQIDTISNNCGQTSSQIVSKQKNSKISDGKQNSEMYNSTDDQMPISNNSKANLNSTSSNKYNRLGNKKIGCLTPTNSAVILLSDSDG
jgi:hypothetical protein